MEMMKKLNATTATLSRHVSPTAMTLAPNCQVAALKASDIQYAMKLVTPHFLSCGGTGSRSLFVLVIHTSVSVPAGLVTRNENLIRFTDHLAFPSANDDLGCST